jgi:TolB-like protein/Tfp pilus assembly protein PilF
MGVDRPRQTGVSEQEWMNANLKEEAVPEEEVLRGLARVLDSALFVQSTRLSRFLRYAVEQMLSGQGDSLKEYSIGTHAYGRKADFDPSQDTIVRTEARRLRRKLKEYYENDGSNDEVVIFFRSGSYVPLIRWRTSLAGQVPSEQPIAEDLWVEGDGVWVAVQPFQADPNDPAASAFAFGVSEEIQHRLIQVRGLRLVSEAFEKRPTQSPGSETEHGAQASISGAVRVEQERLRVTARVTIGNGLVLWSQRFDAAMDKDALLNLQESVAIALLSRIAPREAIVRRYAGSPTQTLYKLYSEALAAEALLEEGSVPSIKAALEKFEALAKRAPAYARLYCGIAQCCLALSQRGAVSTDLLVARTTKACRQAIAIDPEVIEAHSTLGCALAQEWKWDVAEECFRTALRLGDQHSVNRQYAQFLMVRGRFDEAWSHLQVSQALDAFSTRQKTSMARFFYYSRNVQEAKTHYATVTKFGVQPIEPNYFQALFCVQIGELDKAAAIAESIYKQADTVPTYLAAAAGIFALCGEVQKAQALIESGSLLDAATRLSCFRKAILALAVKEQALALTFLEESFRRKEAELLWIGVDPCFDNIRKEQAYISIHRGIFQK